LQKKNENYDIYNDQKQRQQRSIISGNDDEIKVNNKIKIENIK
jgi:hypothetical protein